MVNISLKTNFIFGEKKFLEVYDIDFVNFKYPYFACYVLYLLYNIVKFILNSKYMEF